MAYRQLLSISLVSIAGMLAGCSADNDLAISGVAQEPTATAPITLQFFDPAVTSTNPTPVLQVVLAEAGDFNENVTVTGEKVHVFALSDTNKDGICEDGEPWAELDADVATDGTVAPMKLTLIPATCPKTPSAAGSS